MSEKLTPDQREKVEELMDEAQNDLEGVLFGLVGELAAMTARAELAERQVADFVQAFLDTVDEPPRPNCSCCISPPCADCVDNSGLRRLFVQAKKILAEAGKEGGKG